MAKGEEKSAAKMSSVEMHDKKERVIGKLF